MTRTRVLLAAFAVLTVASMVVTGVFGFLLKPPDKVLVVTMVQYAGEPARDQLKSACGSLAGVRVVRDTGNPDPRIQGRFPVRFDIGRATGAQEAALEACINAHGTKVRGFADEGDN